jgi:radical SAM protein (TIGR01212 family)
MGNELKSSRLYYSFSQYLRERYPFRVQKIPLAAGFTCPNIDGTVGYGGCIYCNNLSFSPNAGRSGVSIAQQIEEGITFYRYRTGARKFIAYFQAHTNTYAPPERLKLLYDQAFSHPDVIGLSIGTRPDCVPDDCLDLLQGYTDRVEVWIEYGVESSHDTTLRLLNRCHDFTAVQDAICRTQGRGLKVCAHVILGLPGEDREMMMETARRLAQLGVDGVKIHHLYISRNTRLEKMYHAGEVNLLSLEEYLSLAAEFLEWLPPNVVVQRLMGELAGDYVIAPQWGCSKKAILTVLEQKMIAQGQYQGRLWQSLR